MGCIPHEPPTPEIAMKDDGGARLIETIEEAMRRPRKPVLRGSLRTFYGTLLPLLSRPQVCRCTA
jgi:hypothetical protein